jgi:hypothetical protein
LLGTKGYVVVVVVVVVKIDDSDKAVFCGIGRRHKY